jgi:hypothetical protein
MANIIKDPAHVKVPMEPVMSAAFTFIQEVVARLPQIKEDTISAKRE